MDLVEAVKRYKREGDYANAVRVLYQLVEETEQASYRDGGGVRSWPYLQLAIIHRKLKETDDEIRVLERFAQQKPSGSKQSHQLIDRLLKVYERAGYIEYREINGVSLPFHLVWGQPVEQLATFTQFGLIVDTETTGRSHQDELIEIALILFKFGRISGRVLEVVDDYSGLRYPRCKIQPQAQNKHGLSVHQLKGQTLDTGRIMGLFERADIVLAHNAAFDRRYVTKLYPSLYWKNWHCTMNGVPWKQLGFNSKGQDAILSAHNIDVGRSHRAMNDARGLLGLLSLENSKLGGTYLQVVSHFSPLPWNDPPTQPERGMQTRIEQIKQTIPIKITWRRVAWGLFYLSLFWICVCGLLIQAINGGG